MKMESVGTLRDWLLITGRGGATTREGGGGGACEVLRLQKWGGGDKVLAKLKGGGATNSFEVVFTQ